jgi:hypothetical protein
MNKRACVPTRYAERKLGPTWTERGVLDELLGRHVPEPASKPSSAPPLVQEPELVEDSGELKQTLNLVWPTAEHEQVAVGVSGRLGSDDQRDAGAVHEIQTADVDEYPAGVGCHDLPQLPLELWCRG